MAKDIKVDGYNGGAAPSPAPAAATFGVGAKNLAEIKQAADARAAHSKKLTNLPFPVSDRDGDDPKPQVWNGGDAVGGGNDRE